MFFLISLLFAACSSSKEVTQEEPKSEEPEIYVFDDATDVQTDSSEVVEEPVPQPQPIYVMKYYVQVGAFTSRERADSFVEENRDKITYPMNISYSDDVMLYVVQLPAFDSREQAERVRNELWKMESFNDAFILAK